jgi:acyl dehydratase
LTHLERLRRFPPPPETRLPELRERLTQERIAAYAMASGDHNPIHLDPDYAMAAGLPSTIAHGLFTLGVAAAQIELWAQGSAWTSRVSCRFSAPLPSGQEVTGNPRVLETGPELAVFELEARNQSGERVLSRATLQLRPL